MAANMACKLLPRPDIMAIARVAVILLFRNGGDYWMTTVSVVVVGWFFFT